MVNKLDNLDLQQLSDILHLVVDDAGPDMVISQPAHSDFLSECLKKPFVGGRFQERAISEIPEILQKAFVPVGQPQLSALICNENSPLLELKRAKSFFNDASKQEKNAVRKEVYIALYYALIAAALVHCKKKITEHSSCDLHHYLLILLRKSWISEPLQKIYRQACDYLQEIQSMDTKS
jgi:hypothetical protein